MIKNLIHHWAEFVINQRLLVIAGALLLMVVAIIPMRNLYYDNSNELFFLENDPSLLLYNQFLDRFDDSESLSIGIEAREGEDSVFTPGTLKMIQTITEFLEDHEFVNKVSSLSKYQYIHSEDDTLETSDLVEDWDELDNSPGAMNRMKRIMEKETLVHGALISKDMKHTIIFARTVYIKGKNQHKIDLTNGLKKLIADNKWEENGYNIRYSGNPIIAERFETITKEDQSWLNPLMTIVILCILFISFRTKTATLMPLVVIIGSLVYVIGLQGVLIWPFNSVLTALPGIIIIVGIGDSVHLIVEFYHFRNSGLQPRESAKNAIKALWLPCFFTSFTTSLGFLSLSITRLVPIRQLGALGSAGSLIAFIISLTVLPALLSFIQSKPKKIQQVIEKGLVVRFTKSLEVFTYKNRYLLSLLCLGLVIVSVVLASKISVDTNYLNYFKKDTKLRQDIEYFDNVFSGAMMMDFMIDSGKPGGIKEPELLKDIARLQEYLKSIKGAGKAVSFADYVKKMNQAMHNDDPAYFTIPNSRDLIAQYLLLYENSGPEENLSDLKTTDERYARVYVPLKNMSSITIHKLIAQIRQKIKTDFPDLNAELTGNQVLFVAQDVYVQQGVVRSFGIALLLIGLCFFAIFRSVKYGLLALIPSIFPIIFTGAIMYVLGISLDMGTMIVGAMTIGIAVDDSIHVMNRYLVALKNGKPLHERIHLALTESGRAVIFSSIILVAGFSVMLLGSFIPFIYTGLFAAVIMSMALLGDLVFLPAIIFVLDKK